MYCITTPSIKEISSCSKICCVMWSYFTLMHHALNVWSKKLQVLIYLVTFDVMSQQNFEREVWPRLIHESVHCWVKHWKQDVTASMSRYLHIRSWYPDICTYLVVTKPNLSLNHNILWMSIIAILWIHCEIYICLYTLVQCQTCHIVHSIIPHLYIYIVYDHRDCLCWGLHFWYKYVFYATECMALWGTICC